jgi:hypothetical protein
MPASDDIASPGSWPMIPPRPLIAYGKMFRPRSVIFPPVCRKPWSASVLVCARPTIWPLLLIAVAVAWGPPGAPMSVIVPFWYFHARSSLAE